MIAYLVTGGAILAYILIMLWAAYSAWEETQ